MNFFKNKYTAMRNLNFWNCFKPMQEKKWKDYTTFKKCTSKIVKYTLKIRIFNNYCNVQGKCEQFLLKN